MTPEQFLTVAIGAGFTFLFGMVTFAIMLLYRTATTMSVVQSEIKDFGVRIQKLESGQSTISGIELDVAVMSNELTHAGETMKRIETTLNGALAAPSFRTPRTRKPQGS